jgi:pimeloyl-ACP methyl ester carboxylesterase
MRSASKRAAVVGHDWGGIVVWQMAMLAAHRVGAVVGVNTPFFPRLPMQPTAMMRAMAQGNFHYVLYFQEPGVADAELGCDVRRTLRGFYQEIPREIFEASRDIRPGVLGPNEGGLLDRLSDGPHGTFLTVDDFEVFARAFERTGFTGGLNWYRNFDRNWETTAYLSGAKVTQPALMITAELDPVLRPEMADGMSAWVPNLRDTVLIKGCGHWTQQEKPAEVNQALLDFLKRL